MLVPEGGTLLMPELPEMETYCRHLEGSCSGLWIQSIEVNRAKSLNVGVREFKTTVAGTAFTGFTRLGKHVVGHLSNGCHLINHLMLGGAIFYGNDAEAPQRTFQVIIRLSNGRALFWYGLRLGWLHLLCGTDLVQSTGELGLDPLDARFTAAHMAALLAGRRGALKPLLVNQRIFPGIGNCYSDEICWEAAIHPLRQASSLSMGEVERLWSAMRSTLHTAVTLGGYTETPFSVSDRLSGGYLPHLKVYDRGAEPCPRCGTPITQAEAGGRKVFACLHCQPQVPERVPVLAIPTFTPAQAETTAH